MSVLAAIKLRILSWTCIGPSSMTTKIPRMSTKCASVIDPFWRSSPRALSGLQGSKRDWWMVLRARSLKRSWWQWLSPQFYRLGTAYFPTNEIHRQSRVRGQCGPLSEHRWEEYNLGKKTNIALGDQYNRLGNETEILCKHFKCNLQTRVSGRCCSQNVYMVCSQDFATRFPTPGLKIAVSSKRSRGPNGTVNHLKQDWACNYSTMTYIWPSLKLLSM